MIEKGLDCPFQGNIAQEDRFSFRTLVQCSTLTVDGYSFQNASSDYVHYLYGGIPVRSTLVSSSSSLDVMTYSYPYTKVTPDDAGHNAYYVMEYNDLPVEGFC